MCNALTFLKECGYQAGEVNFDVELVDLKLPGAAKAEGLGEDSVLGACDGYIEGGYTWTVPLGRLHMGRLHQTDGLLENTVLGACGNTKKVSRL